MSFMRVYMSKIGHDMYSMGEGRVQVHGSKQSQESQSHKPGQGSLQLGFAY